MNTRRETFTRTLPILAAGAVCITGLTQASLAQDANRENVSMDSIKAKDWTPGAGGVAGLVGNTDCPLEENFETFPLGVFALVGGWTGTTFGGNMYIVEQSQTPGTFCVPINGGQSAVHASDGTGFTGFELDSPLFGPCFDPLTMMVRRTAAPDTVNDPATISAYQLVSLDTESGFFNTRVQFNADGSIVVGQLNVMEDPPVFQFFETGVSWEDNVDYRVCITMAANGDMVVFINGEIALQGLSASFVGLQEGLGDPGDVYGGHGQYRTLCDNIGLGAVLDVGGTPGDTTDDEPTCEGDNMMFDDFNTECGGVITAACPGDTDGSGEVDVDDLLNTILCFGTDGISMDDGGTCGSIPSGVNADSVGGPSAGIVDSDDLVSGIILNWGACPVINNECEDAIFLFFEGDYEFSNTGGTLSGFGDFPCGAPGTSQGDIFYKFVTNCDVQTLTLTAAAAPAGEGEADFNPIMEVYEITGDDDCVDISFLACDNDGGGGISGLDAQVVINTGLASGTELLIRIGGEDLVPGVFEGKGSGTFTIAVDCVIPIAPANDDCVNAIALELNSPVQGQTLTATTDPATFNCGLNGGGTGVWYSFVGTGNGMTASMCNTVNIYDATLQVFCGAPGECETGLLCIGGDDDGCGMAGDGTVSEFTFCSEVGMPYLIRISGFLAGDTGNFELELLDDALPCGTAAPCTEPLVLENDNCFEAIPAFEGLVVYSTLDATDDGPAHPECDTAGDGGVTTEDIWYVYTATLTGVIQVTTCEDVACPDGQFSDPNADCTGGAPFADHDTDIVVYEGVSCDPNELLTNILGCNDDDPVNACGTGGGGFKSNLLVEVTAGELYLIRIGSWAAGNNGSGQFLIHNFLPTEDLCDFALEIPSDGVAVELTELDNSFADPGAPVCPAGGQLHDESGIWLETLGNGNDFIITVCALDGGGCTLSQGDIRITVYCGPCAELACVADTVDLNQGVIFGDCGFTELTTSEELQWTTFSGQPYLILVENLGNAGCGWEATITDTGSATGDPPCFAPDECGSAIQAQPRRIPDDAWLFGTTDLNAGFLRYENFTWPGGDIEGLRMWGIDSRFIPGVGFSECTDPLGTPTRSYQVTIWNNIDVVDGDPVPDYGMPFGSNVVATYDFVGASAPADDLPLTDNYGGLPFECWQFDFDFTIEPQGALALPAGDYWVGVQDTDNNVCFLLWLDSRIGDDLSYFDADTTDAGAVLPGTNDRDFSYCWNPTIP